MVPVFFYQFFLLCLIFKYGNSVKNSNCETLPSGEVVCEDTEQRQEEEKKSGKLKDICTIPRIHRSQMTPELFRSSYYLKQPVIVTNVVSSPSAKGWTTEDLLSKYDEVPVGTGSSRTITKMGGTGRASAKLGDIIRALRTNNIHHGDVDVYAFDRDSQLFQHAPQLINDVRNTASDVLGSIFAAPKLPSKVKFNTTAEKPIYRYFLSVGGKGSGVHLHHHSDGWSYLFEGEKRWFVRSPYTLPRITHMGFMRMRYWLSDGVYPKLTFGKKTNDQQMLECVQYPGDLIYVPESWWHGTINEGKPITLSVAAQLVDPVTEFERMMLSASLDKNSGKNNRAFKTLQTLVKKIPNHEEAWYVLGIIYGRVRKHHLDDELEAKQKVYDLIQSTGGADNYSCDVMNNLATAYIHHEMYVKAEVMLRDVIKLCPWDDFPYSNLASALHHQGQEEEAQIAFEKGKKVRDKWSTPDMVTVGNEELML